jgi:hypothetical protein
MTHPDVEVAISVMTGDCISDDSPLAGEPTSARMSAVRSDGIREARWPVAAPATTDPGTAVATASAGSEDCISDDHISDD